MTVLVDIPSRRKFLQIAAGLIVGGPIAFVADQARAECGCVEISGRWPCGSWRSFCTGHTGKLHGVLHRDGCGNYRARFSGTFWKVFPFIYPARLNVVGCENGTVYFRGSQNIPLLGAFCYNGWATCNCFQFNYTSRKDRGVFQMSR
jgi:hypothetical protein